MSNDIHALHAEIQRLQSRVEELENHARQGRERDALFTLSRDLMVVAGLDGRIRYWNPAFERLFSGGADAIRGKRVADLTHPDDLERLATALDSLRRGEESPERVGRMGEPGNWRRIHWEATPDMAAGTFYAVGRDDTERHALHQQLLQAQKLEAVGLLAGGVAHDFNNFLLAMLANLALAGDALPADAPVQEHLADARRAAGHASDLTRRLLAFSRMGPTERQSTDVAPVVLGLTTLLDRLLPANIDISVLEPEGLPSVSIDPGQLEQIVMNLCLNARDAMPDGGRISVRLDDVGLSEEYVEANPWARVGRHVVLEVTDDGMGMDSAVRERIFEPFFTTKGPDRGTGLGLAMVFTIVEQNDGFLHVYSEKGLGTTIRIYLPADDTAVQDRTRPTLSALAQQGDGELILVADDTDGVRTVVSTVLERGGYRVHAVRSGEEAVSALESGVAPRVLLIDVVMPGMSGPETAARVQQLRPDAHVLLTSGYGPAALDPVEWDVIPKPFGPRELLSRIQQALHD